MILRVVLGLWLAASVLYGYYEVRSWRNPKNQTLLSSLQKRIRAWGLLFLLLSISLSLGGTYLPIPTVQNHVVTRVAEQQALTDLAYWSVTALCFVALLLCALASIRESRQEILRTAEEHRKLLEATFEPKRRQTDDPAQP